MQRIKAASLSEAFLAWARRYAVPMPRSHEELLSRDAQTALGRILEGKRFVFLGEPEHCIVEKYPFRLMLIRYLFDRGWRHAATETGRSVGWRVDRYLETGDASCLDTGIEPPSPTDLAIGGKMLEFIGGHEKSFHKQLRRISESRTPGTPRLHYWGCDLDLGTPLASVEPVRRLLELRENDRIRELLSVVDGLAGLSTNAQLDEIEAIQAELTVPGDTLTNA